MKKIPQNLALLFLLVFATGLSGCGPREDDVHGQADLSLKKEEPQATHEHGEEGASYEEGKGISLPEESRKALGLQLHEAGEREVSSSEKLTAQVYRSALEASRAHGRERQGNAYATAFISPDVAGDLKEGRSGTFVASGGKKVQGKAVVLKLETVQMAVLGKTEILLELPDPKRELAVGDFIQVELPVSKPTGKKLSVPTSAVLETSTGTYVYVLNGEHLLRTEIRTGFKNDDFTEITEGLYEGDTVAVKPVEDLYLIELRSTKGGGHSH